MRSRSVLSRGPAIPVAGHVTAANRRGPWLAPGLALLRAVAPAVPDGMRVLVLADRGVWSPRRGAPIQTLGGHPLLRLRPAVTFRPRGGRRVRAAALLPGPGMGGVGPGGPSSTVRCADRVRWGWSGSGTRASPGSA